jgi:tetratricopeptide (TPR) repeat protein
MFLLVSACTSAGETCTPPAEMRSKLQGKPTPAALSDLGVWYADQQQYACAAEAFATSLQTDSTQSDLPHIVFMFGVSLYLSGDVKEGIDSLREAERLGYRDIKLHLVLAAALDSTHATADAEKEWRAALALDPETTTALDSLSSDLISGGDFAGTIVLLESPRLLPQRTPDQSLNLGTAYAETGKLDEAVRVLEDALNTTPDSIDIAGKLAQFLAQLNRRDQAIAVLKLEMERHPNDRQLKQNLDSVLASDAAHR